MKTQLFDLNNVSLQQFYDLLEAHDWTYPMSDDGSVYRKGKQNQSILLKIASQSKEYMDLFDEFEQYNWSGPAWNTERKPKPEKPKE